MKKFALGCALVATLLYPVHAIARTKEQALQGFALPEDKEVTVVLMRPDINIGELQAGGVAEPNAEWTEAARTNVEAALKAELASRSIGFIDMETQMAGYVQREAAVVLAQCEADQAEQMAAILAAEELAAAEAAAEEAAAEGEVAGTDSELTEAEMAAGAAAAEAVAAEADAARAEQSANQILVCARQNSEDIIDPEKLLAEYNALHGAVVDAILIHKYGQGPRDITVGTVLLGGLAGNSSGELPTQEDRFDYTLGSGTSTLGEVAGANYGLFVMTNDQFASGGRKAMQVAGALGCLIGACMIVSGGTHVAYVSLVELETGNIVWFNMQRGSEGDVREEDGAQEMVQTILEGMPTRPGERAASAGGD